MSKQLVVFFGYSSGIGLCYNFVSLFLELYKYKTDRTASFDIKILTTNKEQNEGLLVKLKHIVNPDDLIIINEGQYTHYFDNFKGEIIFHIQGAGQLKYIQTIRKNIKQSNIKIIYTVHAFKNSFWYGGLYSLLLGVIFGKYIDRVIFLSHASLFEFWGRFFIKNKTIISTGVDLSEFTHSTCVQDNKIFNVVYLANFIKNKGHHWLLKSINEVIKVNDQIRFHLLGDGAEFDKIKAKVEKLKLTEYVIMPGRLPRKDIPNYLINMNCAVVASKSETFGHAFIEPMLFELPVIGTPVGVGQEVLKDYRTGFSIPIYNHKLLANRLLFLANNPSMCRKLGLNAKELILSQYGWDRCASAYKSLYDEVFFENNN